MVIVLDWINRNVDMIVVATWKLVVFIFFKKSLIEKAESVHVDWQSNRMISKNFPKLQTAFWLGNLWNCFSYPTELKSSQFDYLSNIECCLCWSRRRHSSCRMYRKIYAHLNYSNGSKFVFLQFFFSSFFSWMHYILAHFQLKFK